MAKGCETFGKIFCGYILGVASICLVWYFIPTLPSSTLQQSLNLGIPALRGPAGPQGPPGEPGLNSPPYPDLAVVHPTDLQASPPANLPVTLAHSLTDWLMRHHGSSTLATGQAIDKVPHFSLVSAALAAAEVPDKFPDLIEVWALLYNSKLLTLDAIGQRLHLITGIKDQTTESLVIPETAKDEYNIKGFPHAEKNLTMLDIGGHIGTIAILFKKTYPKARVISFEPSPVNRLFFAINMVLNGVPHGPEGIELHARALSDADGQKLNIKYNFVDTTGTGAFFPNADKTHSVPTVRLDTTLNEFGLDTVDFMKLDCEGCEFLVLPSCTDATLNQINYVAGEIHPWLVVDGHAKQMASKIMCARKWNINNIEC